jgi:hypothetical protein
LVAGAAVAAVVVAQAAAVSVAARTTGEGMARPGEAGEIGSVCKERCPEVVSRSSEEIAGGPQEQDGPRDRREPQSQEPGTGAKEPPREPSRRLALQLDVIGDYRFSRFNFTDLRTPYNGFDGFTVLRVAAWFDAGRRVGLYGDVIPVVASVHEFFFQRYLQAGVGIQLYLVGWSPDGPPQAVNDRALARRLLSPLRLFAQVSGRTYYDRPPDARLEGADTHVGLDYYWDNLFEPSRLKIFAFTVMGYHTTNFSTASYKGFIWSGNLKAGPAVDLTRYSRLIPYAVVDWTSAPSHRDRFFENFVRAGGGLRWYPRTSPGKGLGGNLLRRLNVYGEIVHNVGWLGRQPPASVEPTDVRVGVAFATGGIYRDRR